MKNIVINTNVLVSGLASRQGASYALLQLIGRSQLRLFASPPLWLEYESVLKRPEIIELHHLTTVEVDTFLDGLALFTTPVKLHFLWRPQLRDPNDEMVLETAVNAMADALITHNLVDFEPAKHRFNLTVITPGKLLKQLDNTP